MKTLNLKMFIFLMVTCSITSFSQDVVYSSIFKNINDSAQSLNHYLNVSGDTLYLESQFDLNKIEVIGTAGLKVYAINDVTKDIRVPLNDLPMGDYTFAVSQTESRDDTYINRKTIVFKISRLLPIDIISMQGMKSLHSNTDLARVNIPILKLGENKIIKDFPEPVGLANNGNLNGASLTELDVDSLASLEVKNNLDSKNLRTKKIDNILESSKPTNYKTYNLTDSRSGKHNVQSRADYRRNNLRPNGKPYN